MWTLREFLGSPLVRCPQARARVHFLVGELRFCKPGSVAKKTQKNVWALELEFSSATFWSRGPEH